MEESSPVQNETDLAIRLMVGEDDAFRELIRVHGPIVKGHLRAKFPAHVADEAFVDAIRKVWAHAISYDESKAPLGAWFLAIAVRCAIDIVRRWNRRDNDELADDYPYMPPDSDEEDIPRKERVRRERKITAVREIMQGMTAQQRAVLEADLAYLCGNVPHDAVAPAEELAQSLNKTKNNIYKIRYDARAKLRNEMERRGFYQEGRNP